MKQTIQQLAFIFCKYSGLNIFMRFLNRKKARVLMYHAVSDSAPENAYWTVITTERFRRQLKHLKRHFTPVSGRDFAESSIDQLKNKVLITFDDGHVNTLTTVLPELKRCGCPAVCFVIPGLSESGKFVWADELHSRMMAAEPTTLRTSLGQVHLGPDAESRMRIIGGLVEQMKTSGNDLRLKVFDEISGALSGTDGGLDSTLKLMSKDEIIQLGRDPLIEIGTHTDTHPILSRLSAEEQLREIKSGLDRLKEWGLDGSLAFAYPNGRPCDYNRDSIEAVQKVGIKMAFTTSDGFVEKENIPFEIRRIPVGESTSQYEFEARMSGAYYLVRRLAGRGEQPARRGNTSTEMIDSLEDLVALKVEWDRLVESTPRKTIFLYYDWLMSWWEVHGSGHDLCVLKLKDDGRLIGLAPFMITKTRGKRVVEFIGVPDADYGDFIGPDPEKTVREAISWLFDHRDLWDEVNLMQVSELSPADGLLRKVLVETRANWFAKPVATCYTFNYTGAAEERRNFAFRPARSMRKRINRLRKSEGFSLEFFREVDEIKRVLPDLFHLHINRWSSTYTPSYLVDESNRQFITRLVERLVPQGRMFLCVSHVDGLPICYTLNFEIDKIMTGYTLAYNQYFFRISPGKIHCVLQCEELVRDGYDLDLSRGDTPFKKTVNAEPSDNLGFTIYQSRYALRMRKIVEALKTMSLLRRLRSDPKWDHRVETLNTNLKRHGLLGTLMRPLASFASWIYYSEQIAIYSYQGKKQDTVSLAENYRLSELNETDLNRFLSFHGIVMKDEAEQRYYEMLESGCKCFLLEHCGLVVGSAWCRVGGQAPLADKNRYSLSERQAMITEIHSTAAFEHLEPIKNLLKSIAGTFGEETEEILAALPIGSLEEKSVEGDSCWRRIEVNRSFKLFGRGSD